MNIKKALASVLTLALLAGCTGGNSTASNTTASTNDNGRHIEVPICSIKTC